MLEFYYINVGYWRTAKIKFTFGARDPNPDPVSGKLTTYPSPKPSFYPKWEVSVNVGSGEW